MSWLALVLACKPGTGVSDDPAPQPTAAATGDTSTTPVAAHNVLVLLTDDQGTDKIGVYGEHPDPPPTPRMDALAAEGVLFRNAWAAPDCSPTRSALLTGRLGRRTGIGGVTQFEAGKEVPLAEVMLPELLATADPPWSTAAIGKWHLGAFNAEHGTDHPNLQGFEVFRGSMGNLYDAHEPDGQRHGYMHWEKITDGTLAKVDRYATTETVDDALELMATLPEPWFLYVAFNAPHKPLDPPPESLHSFGPLTTTSGEKVLYHAVVEALDTEIGRLLDTMDPAQRARTTIVLAGDNGTPDHAILPPLDPSHGKDTPFEGGVNVPLIVAGPLVAQPGSESAALVQVLDVFATVAEIAGVPLDQGLLAGVPLDSQSLVPFLRDPGAPGRDVVFTERFLPVGPGPYTLDWRLSRDARFKVAELSSQVGVFDLSGRFDDGPALDLDALAPTDRAQVDALLAAHEAFWTSIEGPDPR